MSDPDRCNQEIYEKGKVVLVIGDWFSAKEVEAFVCAVADQSGQPVDWHYFAGRAIVRALGNLRRVDEAIYGDPDGLAAWYPTAGPVKHEDYVARCTGGLLQKLMATKKPSEVTGEISYASPLCDCHPGGRNHWSLGD